MDAPEIEEIKRTAKEEGCREALRSQAKEACVIKIIELVGGAVLGGYIGYKVYPTIEGVLIGVAVGIIIFSGLWVFLL